MAVMFRFIEACLIVGMGTFMAVLSQSSLYWQFLNPKYSWLTLVSGIILTIIGFACLLNTQRQRKVSEFLGVVIFLALAVTAITSFSYEVMEDPDEYGGSLTQEYGVDDSPSVLSGGMEFVKINAAELLKGEQEGFVTAGQAYAVQGAVIRTPELDEVGYIGLGRLNITCCFADSIGVVTLVKVADPQAHVHGTWARALGVLEEGAPLPGKTIVLNGALTGVRSHELFLRALEVKEHPVEGVPFIFEVRSQAPFAF